jgi:hypothetical protein
VDVEVEVPNVTAIMVRDMAVCAYRSDVQRCYLKSSAGASMSNNDVTTASPFLHRAGIDYPYNDLAMFTSFDGWESCVAACQDRSDCRGGVEPQRRHVLAQERDGVEQCAVGGSPRELHQDILVRPLKPTRVRPQ